MAPYRRSGRDMLSVDPGREVVAQAVNPGSFTQRVSRSTFPRSQRLAPGPPGWSRRTSPAARFGVVSAEIGRLVDIPPPVEPEKHQGFLGAAAPVAGFAENDLGVPQHLRAAPRDTVRASCSGASCRCLLGRALGKADKLCPGARARPSIRAPGTRPADRPWADRPASSERAAGREADCRSPSAPRRAPVPGRPRPACR